MTSSLRVFPPTLGPIVAGQNSIVAARRVRGPSQWQPLAEAANWLLGKGGSLIVAGPPGAGAIEPGDSVTLKYYLWPREQCRVRLWCVGLMSGTANTTADVSDGLSGTVELPSGADAQGWSIPAGAQTFRPYLFRFAEVVASPTSTPGPIEIEIANSSDSGNDLWISSVSCYELQRAALGPDGPAGVDVRSVETGRGIYDDGGDALSADGVGIAAHAAIAQARRSKLLDWWRTDGVQPTGDTFTGVSNIFVVDPPVIARHLYDGETTREVAVAVMAGCFDTAQVRLTGSETGVPCTLNFSSATPTWVTGTLEIATEDVPNLATNAGIRSGTRDQLIIEGIASVGNISVFGIAIGESE